MLLALSAVSWYNIYMPNTADPIKTPQEYQAEIDALQSELSKLQILIRYYETQLLESKRRQFGSSSEKTDIDGRQMNLFDDSEATTEQPDIPDEVDEIKYKRKKRKGKREEDLSGLPVERIEYELDESERVCPQCGGIMQEIGVDVRRELKLIPSKVIVLEQGRHTYACEKCSKQSDNTPIVKAKGPTPLINGSLASASLVAHISTQKFLNGMPIYRLEKGFTLDGVVISRNTMYNWVIMCSERYLEALYGRLKGILLEENVLHCDETYVQVLREPGRKAQQKSYEWIYRTTGYSKHNIVIYDYQPTRSRKHAEEFLEGFSGYLHTDGYEVYHGLSSDIIVAGCWSHCRRPWEKAYKALPKDKQEGSAAEQAIAYINELFRLERTYKDLTPGERYEARLEKSKPVADSFFEWAAGLGALPKSLLGEAVGYTLNQCKYLNNVFLDGRLELSNNRAERSIKPFVMGRKAWLFSTSVAGAKASSVLYSIIETARENGLHPYHYLEYLLTMLPYSTMSELDRLLPWSTDLPAICHAPKKTGGKANGENKRV